MVFERGPKSKYFVVYSLRFGMEKKVRILLAPSEIHHFYVCFFVDLCC
jgi:hypothetical protein